MLFESIKNVKVYYTDNPSPSILTAKEELCSYLVKKLPCFINVSKIQIGELNGLPKQDDLKRIKKHDGFLLKVYGDTLCICGKTDEGTLFGTYHFIEKYIGVEWLAPDCEILTDGKPVTGNLDTVFDFSTYMRWNHCWAGLDQKYRARQRLNYTVGDINDKPAYGGLRGIKFAFSWGYFGHTFEILLPYEKYYLEHPEWYSFAEAHYGENHRYQICLTNPEVLEIVTKNALDYLEKNPDCRVISISQNDAYADFEMNNCMCDNCRKIYEADGNYSAVMLQFVNKVARRIKQKHPDVYVHTLAYHFTEEPPKTIVPDDNIIVQFCLHLPFGYSITEDNSVSEKEKVKYDSWRKICDKVFIWNYICCHSYYFAPIGNFKSLYENTAYFLNSGIFGLFQQGNHDYTVGDFSNLRAYLTAKLLQNPNMTYEEYCSYLQTYLNGYFGEGGQYIYEYLQALDQKFYHQDINKLSLDQRIEFYGEDGFIKYGKELYAKALHSVNDPIYAERIERNRLQLDFCELCSLYLKTQKDKKFKDEYVEKHKVFYYKQKELGVVRYRENNKIPELSRVDYEKSPYALCQKDKEILLSEGKSSDRYFADESTSSEDYGFTFDFSVFAQGNSLRIDVNVKDLDIWCNSDNITDWAQDCVEIYISEDFNRTRIKNDKDYTYRINAEGVCYAFGHPEKVKSCISRKTETGYCISLTVELDKEISTFDKIGFEIMAHDCDKNGKYRCTRYWNALKFASVSNRPDCYGILAVKKEEK